MKKTLALCVLALISTPFLYGCSVASAESSPIIIKQYVSGLPITAPSTPSSIIAIPISQSEIFLSWATSTDSYGIAGYAIFRDGLPIATTGPETTYLDQGLSASTTYNYFVQAFNIFSLYSSSSPAATATTLSLPPPLPPTPTPVSVISLPGNTGGSMLLRVYNLLLEPVESDGQLAINVKFETNLPVRVSVRYGNSADLNLGSIASDKYSLSHDYLISQLPRAGIYYLGIELRTYGNVLYQLRPAVVMVGSARPVPSPRDLSIEGQGAGLLLNWQNPSPADYDEVVLLRSDSFYPVDRWSGEPVARGRITSFFDREIQPRANYYYALFACTNDGRCSNAVYATRMLLAPGWSVEGSTPGGRELNVFVDEVFRISGRPIGKERETRLVVLHIFQDSVWKSSHQLALDESDPTIFTTKLSIGRVGTYHYRIDQYGFGGGEGKTIDSGIIKVSPVRTVAVSQGGITYYYLNLIAILIIILILLVRRRRVYVKMGGEKNYV